MVIKKNIHSALGEELIENANNEVFNRLKDEKKQQAIKLKKQAKKFLEDTKTVRSLIININEMEKKKAQINKQIKNTTNEDISQLQQELRDLSKLQIDKNLLNQFVDLSLKFQNQVNNFLGQTVKVIYVYSNTKGDIIKLYEFNNNAEHIISSFGSKGSGFRPRYQNLGKKTLNNKYEQIKEKRNFDVEGLNKAYYETIQRGRTSKEVRGNKGSLLILWKPNYVWEKMLISSQGDIKESYASFYLMNKFQPPFSKNSYIETLLNDFLTSYPSGVKYVDNISGLLEGDITIGNIQYAVKSKGASSLGYNQIIELAQYIDQQEEDFLYDYLKNYKQFLHEKGVQRNDPELQLAKDRLNSISQQEIDQIIKKINNQK